MKPKTFLFVHIDNNVGVALVIDKKIYQGRYSFSGGLAHLLPAKSNLPSLEIDYLDYIIIEEPLLLFKERYKSSLQIY